MEKTKHIVSFDCGNSSFRAVLGTYDGKRVKTEVISQMPNEMIELHGLYYWDILHIYSGLLAGLKTAAEKYHLDSIGICTWGIDFSLFNQNGMMLANPLSYRNEIGAKCLTRMDEQSQQQLFNDTGILCDKINSCYMLDGIRQHFPKLFTAADKLLMIPDILNYFFTGTMMNEPSELSTTQLYDVAAETISSPACERFKIDKSWFSEISIHGKSIGMLRDEIRKELGITYDIPVIAVPSHDTAAAVLAVPAAEKQFAFISSGTWALIGTERERPLISEEVRTLGLTNEVGAFGTITLLKNNAGMFLIQRLKREYQWETKQAIDWETFNSLGDGAGQSGVLFDVNHSRFFNPADMSEEIWQYLIESRQASGEKDWNMIIRSFQESMACSYALTIKHLERVGGKSFGSVYIVGGGAKNTRLCRITANCTGKKVVAGGQESTSLGNILAQIKYFEPDKTMQGLRRIVIDSIATETYLPDMDMAHLIPLYEDLPK